VTALIFQSSLSTSYRDALERLVFFNGGQRDAETAIADVVDLYGSPVIVAGGAGLRVVVSSRDDVQCVFALAPGGRGYVLAGMVLFLRTSVQQVEILHIAVADRYRRARRSRSGIVIALVQTVRECAQRLRGVERLTILYLPRRTFRIAGRHHTSLVESRASERGHTPIACH
jgi:hypothetical protein